jgi:hypothetical protein
MPGPSVIFRRVASVAFVSLAVVAADGMAAAPGGSGTVPAAGRGPSIEADAKAEADGLTFRWTVADSPAALRDVTVVVRKGGQVLRTASTTEPSGRYHFNPYRRGRFRLEVSVLTADGRRSARAVDLATEGNEPSPCPSRAVWMPPIAEAPIRGLEHYSVAELVRQSSLVFAGDATDIQFCQPEASTIPFTFVTFSRLNVIRGVQPGPEVTLAFAGGVMDGYISDFEDMPKFDRRQRYVLFVTARPRYRLVPTVGWSEGVLIVDSDGVRTYGGDTVTGLDADSHELTVAPAVPPRPVRFDPAYGVYRIVGGGRSEPRVGPPGRVVMPPPGDATPVSEAVFLDAVRALARTLAVADAPAGRLLPPGTPFAIGPVSPGSAPPRQPPR